MTQDDYFQEIARDPANVDLRRIFGDWLLEQGDPWGELVNLQDERLVNAPDAPPDPRERQLIREHGAIWLGPMAPLLDLEKTIFERGFPVICHPRPNINGLQIADALGDPRWALVREVHDITRVWNRLILSEALSSLRVVIGLEARLALRLLLYGNPDDKPLPFEEIEVRHAKSYRDGKLNLWAAEVESWGDCRRMPHLKRLRFVDRGIRSFPPPRHFRSFWSSPLGQRLEHFGPAVMSLGQVIQWWQECREHGDAFQGSLELCMPDLSLTFSRDDEGQLSRLLMTVDRRSERSDPPADGLVAQALRVLPEDALTGFEAVGDLEEPGLIAGALERQQRLSTLGMPQLADSPSVDD